MSRNQWAFGERSRYGKHTPPGVSRGVRRGVEGNGALSYNGHRHVPQHLRKLILDFVGSLTRPTTAHEITVVLGGYSNKHIARVLSWMHADGDLARSGQWASYLWTLPSYIPAEEPSRRCSKCREVKPADHFGRDRTQAAGRASQCRQCRSPKADKDQVRTYPDRQTSQGRGCGGQCPVPSKAVRSSGTSPRKSSSGTDS